MDVCVCWFYSLMSMGVRDYNPKAGQRTHGVNAFYTVQDIIQTSFPWRVSTGGLKASRCKF